MNQLLDEAIAHFNDLQAQTGDLREPTAMSFATVDEHGRPSVRTLLLKQVNNEGFVFFTNTSSQKGQHLAVNPYAALCVYFQQAHQQVQVEGRVEPVSEQEADAYWQTRARASQIGAWASRQSAVLEERQQLLDRIKQYEEEFAGVDVPRPEFWSGYRVIPQAIEFWQGHPDRLNQRICYELRDEGWVKFYRYP